MFLRLSYDLQEGFPPTECPNPNHLEVEQVDHIGKKGKSNNRFAIKLTTHIGTHIDAPHHFNPKGKRIADFPIESYVFAKPLVIDVRKNDEEFIYASDLVSFARQITECDLLMLRTGFSKYRFSNPLRYATRNPGMSEEAAKYIVDNFDNVRAVAIDAISMEFEGNFDHRFQAHKIFLNAETHPIFIIEDVNMDFDLSLVSRIIALPLYIDKIDGCPCTIIAELTT